MDAEIMTLETLLAMLIGGGATGTVSYLLLKVWPWFKELEDPDTKRWLSIAANGLVVLAAWGASLWLGFSDIPGPDAQAWVTAIANVLLAGGGMSFVTSQAWHTKDLRQNMWR